VKSGKSVLVALSALLLCSSLAAEGHAETPPPLDAVIIGRLVMVGGAPVTGPDCFVIEGTPLKASCDANGYFIIPHAFGSYSLIAHTHVSDINLLVPNKVVWFATVDGQTTNLGDIVVGKGASITGKVSLGASATADDYERAVVGIPELGLYVPLGVGGQYLFTGVSPGSRTIYVYAFNGSQFLQKKIMTARDGQLHMRVDINIP
jgi:hypothetical protein